MPAVWSIKLPQRPKKPQFQLCQSMNDRIFSCLRIRINTQKGGGCGYSGIGEELRDFELFVSCFFFVVTRWSSIVSIMILSRWNPQQNDYNWLFFIRFLPISFVRVTRMRMCQLILETLPIISDKCWYRMAYFCCFYCMYFCWNSSCLL